MKLRYLLPFLLLFSCSSPELNRTPAAAAGGNVCGKLFTSFPDYPGSTRFQKQIVKLEEKLSLNETAHALILTNMTAMEETLEQLKKQRKFWDSFLWGFFGDKKLLRQISDEEFSHLAAAQKLEIIEKSIKTLDHDIKQNIEEFLIKVEERFKEFYQLRKKYRELVCSGKKCTEQISAAKEALGDNDASTPIDLLLNSKRIAVLSTIQAPESHQAVKKAIRFAEEFMSQLESFNHSLEGLNTRFANDELEEIVKQVTEKSYAFKKINTVLKLSELDKEMTQLSKEISEIVHELNKDYSRINDIVIKYVCLTRQICLKKK